jgi:hypothetical protein
MSSTYRFFDMRVVALAGTGIIASIGTTRQCFVLLFMGTNRKTTKIFIFDNLQAMIYVMKASGI